MTTDAQGNLHSPAGTPSGGQFAGKASTKPTVSLTLDREEQDRRNQARLARSHRHNVKRLFDAARGAMVDSSLHESARLLRTVFPGAKAVLLLREPHSGVPYLAGVVLDGPGAPIAWAKDGSLVPEEHGDAVSDALSWVHDVADDGLARPGRLQDASDEYRMTGLMRLDITDPAPGEDWTPSTMFVSSLGEEGRINLDGALGDFDGRLPSMVDTGEIAYRLGEEGDGDSYGIDDHGLVRKLGSHREAARAIADTSAWHEFGEDMAETVRLRLDAAIQEAAAEAAKGGS